MKAEWLESAPCNTRVPSSNPAHDTLQKEYLCKANKATYTLISQSNSIYIVVPLWYHINTPQVEFDPPVAGDQYYYGMPMRPKPPRLDFLTLYNDEICDEKWLHSKSRIFVLS